MDNPSPSLQRPLWVDFCLSRPAETDRSCVKTFFSAIGAHCWNENRVSTQNADPLSSR